MTAIPGAPVPAPSSPRAEFVRAISRLDATALVVGSMIGSGIFIVSGDIIREVQSPGLLLTVWTVAGLVTLLGAVTYGELAAMYPKAGGQYVYLREGISPLFGFLYGWTLFTVIQTATIAAVAVAFARFTAVLVPALSERIFLGGEIGGYNLGVSGQRLFAILSVIVLTWINVRGVRTAALIQTTLTVIKTSALIALILLGVTIGRNAEAIAANFGAGFWPATGFTVALIPIVAAAMVGALFSMDAWNNVGFASGEMKNPEKDIPFAMAVGVLIVTVLYVLANVSYLHVLPGGEIARTWTEGRPPVGTAALQQMFGDPGLRIMAVAIMISTFGCNNALILAGARVYYAMARDDLFFRRTGELHPTHRTPAFALVIQAVWTSLLCLSGTYGDLLNYIIIAAVLFYMVTVVGLIRLRITQPNLPRPVTAPGYPWLPALYVAATGLICVNLLIQKPLYTWPGLVIVALGIPVYYAWRRRLA
ncbi:MAG: APC family permease [Gemmatimonadales bacterium]